MHFSTTFLARLAFMRASMPGRRILRRNVWRSTGFKRMLLQLLQMHWQTVRVCLKNPM